MVVPWNVSICWRKGLVEGVFFLAVGDALGLTCSVGGGGFRVVSGRRLPEVFSDVCLFNAGGAMMGCNQEYICRELGDVLVVYFCVC